MRRIALVGLVAALAACKDAPREAELRKQRPAILTDAYYWGDYPLPHGTVILTYDDGPDTYSLPLAQWLHDQGVPATFFITGCRIEGQSTNTSTICTQPSKFPASVIGQIAALGHRVANHSHHHRDLPLLVGSPQEIHDEIAATQAILDPYITDGVYLFRAPYHAWDGNVAAAARQFSDLDKILGSYGADLDEADWSCAWNIGPVPNRTPEQCAQLFYDRLRDRGSGIVNLHDWLEGAIGTDYQLRLTQALVTLLKNDPNTTFRFALGGPATPPTACTSDASCSASQYCAGGFCQPKLGSGRSCSATNQCTSGFCVDGVCCDQACGGQCQACDVAGHVGTCFAVTGAPHGSRAACATDGSVCGATCNGTNVAACTFPGASTTCRAASCTSGVATLSATCNGAGACPAVQTQACTPFVCGPTACRTSCTTDAHCIAGDYCSGGACVPRLTNGATCSAASQCASGFCVDGLCCNQACGGQCQACDVAGHLGTCFAVAGAPHGSRAACATDGSACGGSCNGTNVSACTYAGSSTACRAASCASGTATLPAWCAGTGSCPPAQTQSCTPYGCGASACLGNCSSDGNCAPGNYCSGGVCVARLPDGASCGTPNQCASGFCVDGLCCDQACGGQCQACDVAGHVGTCFAVTGAPHGSRAACATDGSDCGGSCNGANVAACSFPGASTACRAPSCTSGVATLAASCSGAGACPGAQTQACAPYACGPTTCNGNCASDGDCAAGTYCSGGVCAARLANGASCGAPGQCASGFCVDGACCDAACNGQCEACDAIGLRGTCVPVVGAPHGARTACSSDASACAGACDGSSRTGCSYPGAAVVCRAASCTVSVATLEARCSGSGQCPAPQTQDCHPATCGPSACLGGCTADGDCAAGSFCSAGVCSPKLTNGTTCAGAHQCASGICADGVCCDAACSGQCEACDVAGHVGTCFAVTGAPHAGRAACTSDGSACGGVCDGWSRSACAQPGSAIVCRSPACSAGTATPIAFCDGSGACPAAGSTPCAPYACDGAACRTACASESDCAAGASCVSGRCVASPRTGPVRMDGGCSAGGAAGWPLLLLLVPRLLRRRRDRAAA